VGPYMSQKRKQPGPSSEVCPGCGAPLGRGHTSGGHADGCLFILHYPDGVKIRRSKEFLPVTKFNSLANAISQYKSHRIDVTKCDRTCNLCSSAENDPMDLSEDGADADALANPVFDPDDEEEGTGLVTGLRLIKRRSYRPGSSVIIGEGERARVFGTGLTGWLNDLIVTMAMEYLWDRGGRNIRAVPTNYYPVGDRDDQFAYYMQHKEWPDKLLIAVNMRSTHWCLFVVEKEPRRVEFWNGLDCSETDYKLLKQQLIRRLNYGNAHSETHWSLENIFRREDLPQQVDGYNCGVMILLYAESIICNMTLVGMSTDEKDLALVRKNIWSLLSRKDKHRQLRLN
jgi:hypothetical protein